MQSLRRNNALNWFCVGLMLISGCTQFKEFRFSDSWESAPSYHNPVATRIEYPNVKSCLDPTVTTTVEPLSLENPAEIRTRDLELNEAIQIALSQSDVLRSLGGSVVQNPVGTRTNYEPAITESNPNGGVEAALSAFDAQVSSQLFWSVTDTPNNFSDQNNPLAGAFQVFASQGTGMQYLYDLSKRTATGASFAARHNINFSNTNGRNRLYTGAYIGFFEAEYRQPLLRGAGVEFNRIAGPNSGIGNYRGVLIARINTDISLADFEAGIINFINDVETAYWELFYSYHNLEAQVAGRNSSLLTWQRIKELQKVGARGGDAAAEAQSRSQYYTFDAQVKNALAGPTGIYAQEQSLRYLIGLPATDDELIKPITMPMEGEVKYDWSQALGDALTKRVEIRRQKWSVKRRELELIAARLNKRPTLDFLAQYRFRGLGDALIESYDSANATNSLYQSILTGDFQEWQAGVEFGYPIGLRQAGAAVANARLNLAKEQTVLEEQELRISHDLSSAARQVRRNYALMLSIYDRQDSDRDQVEALQARYESGLDNINFLLQAQRDLAASQSAYYRALVDYQLALRDFHREKGSLLDYNQVGLSEGAWPVAAYRDAQQRGRFFAPRPHPEKVEVPCPISDGGFNPTQVGAGANGFLSQGMNAPLMEAIPSDEPLGDYGQDPIGFTEETAPLQFGKP